MTDTLSKQELEYYISLKEVDLRNLKAKIDKMDTVSEEDVEQHIEYQMYIALAKEKLKEMTLRLVE